MLQIGDFKADFLALVLIAITICSVVASIASIFRKSKDDIEE